MQSSIRTTETTESPTPTEVLIPEARQRPRQRYRRRGVFVLVAALGVAALVVSSLLLLRGPTTRDKAQAAPKPVAAALGTAGSVYFRPVLCFAAPYAPPAGAAAQTAPTGTESIPACSTTSLLSPANLDVLPDRGPQGYSSNITTPDQQYASYPSSSVHKPGYASSTVLLPGVKGACDGISQMRCVLGPVEMSSRAIAKATAMRNQTGQWVVDYTTTAAGSALWDRVTRASFHGFLGIELNGEVYSAPLIQPTRTAFSSFDGRGEISGNLNRSEAVRLASALNAHKG